MGTLQMAIPFMYEQGGEDDGGSRELRLLIHQSIVQLAHIPVPTSQEEIVHVPEVTTQVRVHHVPSFTM